MRQQLVKHIKENAFEEGEFTLSSGKKSNYYINIKKIYTDTDTLKIISYLILQELAKHHYKYKLAGVALGGVPIVVATAINSGSNMPYLIVRKEEKGYGVQNSGIEGMYEENENVILLEDVTTTGKSSLNAAIKLRNAGLCCSTIITLIDRQDGSMLLLRNNDISLIPIISINELMDTEVSI